MVRSTMDYVYFENEEGNFKINTNIKNNFYIFNYKKFFYVFYPKLNKNPHPVPDIISIF